MRLSQVLYSQGFGSRRECAALLQRGEVRIGERTVDDGDEDVDTAGLVVDVSGTPWPFHAKALLLMHKPAGVECSRSPQHHASVLALLPLPLRRRGVQPVGRLDADTTGALLLTDDGALNHRLCSPRFHVPKVYEVGTRHAVDTSQVARLLEGVLLHDEPSPVRAAACEVSGERSLRLTLTDGRYHQVKRMLAAVGNRVDTLHRNAFGALHLPTDLLPGHWRWLDLAEREALSAAAAPGAPG